MKIKLTIFIAAFIVFAVNGQSGLQKSLVCNDTTNNKGSKHVVTTPQMVTYVGSHGGGGGGGDTVTQIETRHHAAITYKSKGDSLRTVKTDFVTQFQKNADTTKHYNWDVLQLAGKQNTLTNSSTITNGVKAVTQSTGDNTSKLATDSFVMNKDSAYYGREFLYNYDAALAKDSCIINLMGDSWTMGVGRYVTFLKRYTDANYGTMGDGYLSFYCDPAAMPNGSIGSSTTTKTGTWTQVGGTFGANLTYSHSTDIATPGKLTLTGMMSAVKLHYLKISGGGSFTWQLGALGATTTISTDSATTGTMSYLNLTSLPVTAIDTLIFKVTVAGSAGVNICGANITLGTTGIKINNLGVSGIGTSYYNSLSFSVFKSIFKQLTPHLNIIMLGVNDLNGGATPAVYRTNLDTLINRIKLTNPKSDIVLMSPADIGASGMGNYIPILKSLAIKYKCGFINNYSLFGSYSDGNTRGLYANASHLTSTGDFILYNNLIKYLNRHAEPLQHIVADPNKGNTSIANSINNGYYSSMGLYNYSFSNVVPSINGNYNSHFGYGTFNPSGSYNNSFGTLSLYGITTGYNNNTFGGSSAQSLTTGHDINSIGYNALYSCTAPTYSFIGGNYAAYYLTACANNVIIGDQSMYNSNITNAQHNVMIGYRTGYIGNTFYYNTYIGELAGYGKSNWTAITQQYQVKIGYKSGANDSTNNRLFIDISGTNSPLLGGQFDNRRIGINKLINKIATTLEVGGNFQISSTVLNSDGGYMKTFTDTICTALSGASGSIPVNVPIGAKLLGVQLRVDVAITSGDGATSWTAAYATGSTQSITTGQAFTKNTKVNKMFDPNVATPITTGTTTITITPNSGTFSAGVVRAVCYYETFTAMGNKP